LTVIDSRGLHRRARTERVSATSANEGGEVERPKSAGAWSSPLTVAAAGTTSI